MNSQRNYRLIKNEVNRLLADILKNLPDKFDANLFIGILRKIAPLLYAEMMKTITERFFLRWIAWYYIPQELVRKGVVIGPFNSGNAFTKTWSKSKLSKKLSNRFVFGTYISSLDNPCSL